MDILITTVVADRVRPLRAALPPMASPSKLVAARPVLAPCPDQALTGEVRHQDLSTGEVSGVQQPGWPFAGVVMGVDTDAAMGSYLATRDHKTDNSIKFGNRQGPPCSPPV